MTAGRGKLRERPPSTPISGILAAADVLAVGAGKPWCMRVTKSILGIKNRPAFKFTVGILFDRQNRTFRQELDTLGDAAAQSRFDAA